MAEETDVQPIYEKLDSESAQWFAKFRIYRNMSASTRNLLEAYRTFCASEYVKSQDKPAKAIKNVPGAWKQAFERYDWKFRAEQYDLMLQAEQENRQRLLREAEAAEIERIMSTGYAAKHRRIEALSEMATLIKLSFLKNPEESLEEVKFEWVTPDKIREFRGCLDDIAKELGDRVNKKELTGKDGGPIVFLTEWGGGALASEEEVDDS